METLLKLVTAMLFSFLKRDAMAREIPCGQIWVQPPVLVLGSSFNTSCHVPEGCRLVEGRSFYIELLLNGRILAGQPPANQNSRTSSLTVYNFSDTEGILVCQVCWEGQCQKVDGATITGGYPPSVPQKLSCLTNLTEPATLTCKWDPGTETHLPTNYTLHTKIRDSQTKVTFGAYPLPVGQHSCTLTRGGFPLFRKMSLWVTAQNALGLVSSEPLFMDPMDSAMFDPPVLVDVWAEPARYGCLSLRWKLPEQQQWVTANLQVQVRFEVADSEAWTIETKGITQAEQQEVLQQCGLLHGTDYRVQMRVRYGPGPWSEWGNRRAGTTLEKAPTGGLNVWLKVLGKESQRHNTVQLFWKPSHQFRANGKNVSFHVFLRSPPGRGGQRTVCRTQQRHCEAVLPKGTRSVYITAYNSAGESSVITAPVHQHWGLEPISDVTVSSMGATSLQVTWTPLVSPVVMGYVVEWVPQLQMDPRFLSFLLLRPNETFVLISAGIEPYRPYLFSVYARYQTGVSLPAVAQGYSMQKAPAAAPSMRVAEILHTRATLTWEEIPLHQRHGIIQNYTVRYWDEAGRTRAVGLGPTERSLMLTKLNPLSMYKAFISASTEGGAVNGTVLTLKTGPAGAWGNMFVVVTVTACVGLMLCFILSILACLTKQERLKMHFWPMIPDPANSSIRTWTEGDTLPECPAFQSMKDIQDPVPVQLSWFSLLDVPEGQSEKSGEGVGPTMDDLWLQGDDPSDPGKQLKDASHDPEPAKEAVPYATVVFASPYLSQANPASTAYLRSDSTQPLLGEESPSPRSYQNFHFQEGGGARESMQSQGGSGAFWEEFPLLSVLSMQEAQSKG